MSVKMYGPAFDDTGELVERDVPDLDVQAYENVGYKRGPLPEELKSSVVAATEAVSKPKKEKK